MARSWFLGLVLLTFCPAAALAVTLPEHEGVSVLVIGDAVNPHQLSAADLTEWTDISVALSGEGAALQLRELVRDVHSQCVEQGLTLLNGETPPDVVIYFAHRAALGCDGSEQQTALDAALESHLERGGGLVVFHHGVYTAPGKEALLARIGVSANSIAWDTTAGQRIFNVAPEHFITSNGVDYSGSGNWGPALGLAEDSYAYFDNVPDERYPETTLLDVPGAERTLLFVTDSGPLRALGYTLTRPEWLGSVVVYQPGEYQPNALTDKDGNGLQILSNAVLFASGQAHHVGPAEPTLDAGTTAPPNVNPADAQAALPHAPDAGARDAQAPVPDVSHAAPSTSLAPPGMPSATSSTTVATAPHASAPSAGPTDAPGSAASSAASAPSSDPVGGSGSNAAPPAAGGTFNPPQTSSEDSSDGCALGLSRGAASDWGPLAALGLCLSVAYAARGRRSAL